MKANSSEQGREVIESIKSSLHNRIQEWLGFDIPSEGDEDYDTWQLKLMEVDDIETFEDVLNYIECEGEDINDFLIDGEWDLSLVVSNPKDLPTEVFLQLGEEIVSEARKDGSWAKIYEYGKWIFAENQNENRIFLEVSAALDWAKIGKGNQDDIVKIIVPIEYEHLLED